MSGSWGYPTQPGASGAVPSRPTLPPPGPTATTAPTRRLVLTDWNGTHIRTWTLSAGQSHEVKNDSETHFCKVWGGGPPFKLAPGQSATFTCISDNGRLTCTQQGIQSTVDPYHMASPTSAEEARMLSEWDP